jgi:ABC-type bacteriocin/lantibiotic exporter with double-glycine peptidase domain
MAGFNINPVRRILRLLQYERKDIGAIYFYAIFNGMVQLSLPLGIQSIISFVMGGAFSTSLVLLISMVVIGVFVNGLLQVNQMKIIEKIQQQLFVRYSFLYSHTIPKLNLRSIDDHYLPELVNRFFDIVSLQKGLSKLLLDIPAATIQIFFGLLLLSFYHPVFIFFSLTLVFIVYGILYFTGSRGMESSIEESNYKYEVAGWLQEMSRVVNTVKFNRGTFFHLRKADEGVSGYLNARTRHFRILLFQYWSLVIFKVVITATMLIVGSLLLIDQQLNIGQFIAAEIVIISVLNAVEKLIGNLDMVYDVMTSVEKLAKVTEKPMEKSGDVLPKGTRGVELTVSALSFGYEEGGTILDNISFEASPGAKVCINGKLGSGKSTLLRVLTGAYAPYTGIINIDGIPLSHYDLDALRSQTGIVLENQDLFKGTIWENLTFNNAALDQKDVLRLSDAIGLGDFIRQHPEGLEMSIDPMGKRLPMRVVKKIMLVRALCHKPRLLLMEEPWTGLEEENAEKVKSILLNEYRDATLIIVTDDEGFAAQCDQVINLENGSVSASLNK